MILAIDGREAASEGTVHAAGAVVWRERRGRLEVALVHRPRYRDWSWPKGKLDPGESVPAAAAREVAEETGDAVVLGAPLPALRYRTPDGRRKHVRYWAARVATDDDAPALAARGEVPRAGLDEIDDVVWVSAPTAVDLLTRREDRAPLAAVVDLHERDRLATRALAVVRHGQAVKRGAWDGDDASRPLTPDGAAQAASLVPVLAAFGVTQAVTSPWTRCRATVAPYADASGARVREEDVLSQDAHRADPAGARAVAEGLVSGKDVDGADRTDAPAELAQAGLGTMLSLHRPVLPTVLGVLTAASRRWTSGELPRQNPWLRPGEAVVAHLDRAARAVAFEIHRPPNGTED